MSISATSVVDLGTDPSIRTVGSLRDQLSTAISQNQSVEIGAEAVTSIDVSMLQLLASAHRTAQRAGKHIAIRAAPHGPMRDALVRAGFITSEGVPLTAEGAFWTFNAAKDQAA
jgi:anti-anti-sigma regulatory factor